MARRSARLADLVHVGEEGKNGLAVPSLIDERLARAERCAGCAQEVEDDVRRVIAVGLTVELFLGPAGTRDEEKLRIGTNRLRILCGRAKACNGGARGGKIDGDLLDAGWARFAAKSSTRACIEQQEPGALVAPENSFHALAIEPARSLDSIAARNR